MRLIKLFHLHWPCKTVEKSNKENVKVIKNTLPNKSVNPENFIIITKSFNDGFVSQAIKSQGKGCKLYLRIGLKQEKIYCVPEFNQSQLLKPYSEFNTNKEWKQKKIKTKVGKKYCTN